MHSAWHVTAAHRASRDYRAKGQVLNAASCRAPPTHRPLYPPPSLQLLTLNEPAAQGHPRSHSQEAATRDMPQEG